MRIHKMPKSIYIYEALCQSVSQSVCHVLFVPRGQTFLAHGREGGKTFFTHRGGGKHFYIEGGGQTFFVGGSGGFDDVDEEIDVSEANFLVNEGNILVSEASKLSAGARILGTRWALKF